MYLYEYTCTQQGEPGTAGASGVRGIVGIPVSPTFYVSISVSIYIYIKNCYILVSLNSFFFKSKQGKLI